MNGEKIWESLQDVDPEWIEDAAKYPNKKPIRMTMRRMVSLAACFAMMLTSGGLLLFGDFGDGGQIGAPDSTTASFVSSSFSLIQIVLLCLCIASLIGMLIILLVYARREHE